MTRVAIRARPVVTVFAPVTKTTALLELRP